jgi:hypothetical protein
LRISRSNQKSRNSPPFPNFNSALEKAANVLGSGLCHAP